MSKQNTRATIDANIKQNGQQQITGAILNSVLNTMVTDYAEQEKLTDLERKVNALALGAFYGYFPDSASLPTDVATPGYAYVGTDNPYVIWNFNGTEWSDSGTSIDMNDADEEDITRNADGKLQFKDRDNTDGMGYVILRKDKTFAEQVTEENTIYEVRYDFDLDGEDVSVPANCILKFNGGKLSNGTIIGDIKLYGFPILEEIAFDGLIGTDTPINESVVFLEYLGVTNKEEDAQRNVTIINDAIKKYSTLILPPFLIPINDVIIIDHSRFYLKGGEDRQSYGFVQINDGKDIIDIVLHNVDEPITILDGIIEGLTLRHKNWQINTSAAAINFVSEKQSGAWSWGWQQLSFRHLYIKNSAHFVTSNLEPVWDTTWEDILCHDIAKRAIMLNSLGQLQNTFRSIKILNYNHNADEDHNYQTTCIVVSGEALFDNIDIEDWWGSLFKNESATAMQISNSHFERVYLTEGAFITIGGNLTYENNTLTDAHILLTNIATSLFWSVSGTIVCFNNYLTFFNGTRPFSFFYYKASNVDSGIIASNNNLFNIVSSGWDGGVTANSNVVVDGVRYDGVIPSYKVFSSDEEINKIHSVKEGDLITFKKSNGDVVKLFSKYRISPTNTTEYSTTVNYTNILSVSSSAYNAISIGEALVIRGEIYLCINKYGSALVLDKYVMYNGNITFRKVLPSESFRQFDGNLKDVIYSGNSASRPSSAINGTCYFDITLGKPIWKNDSNWVDATGAVVG